MIKDLTFEDFSYKIKSYFIKESGGKRIFDLKSIAIVFGSLLLLISISLAWHGPGADETFYAQTSRQDEVLSDKPPVSGTTTPTYTLFNHGLNKLENDKRSETLKRQRKVSIKYFASQLIEVSPNTPKAMRSGAKLIGFLMTSIDTRHSSTLRVRLPQGGDAGGVEIEPGSILVGQFNYPGQGATVFLSFSRLDTPDGESKTISAVALDSGTYIAGVKGKNYSDTGLKVAGQLGLTMFSGMADVMTEKESLGFSTNSVQAKSNMQNALLQGLSRAAQDQTARTASELSNAQEYAVIPEGKEMIIELSEDYR